MSDLIERLREGCLASNDVDCLKERCKAADEIERLRAIEKSYIALHAISGEQKAENERLRDRIARAMVEDADQKAENERLRAALDKLARLGNEPHYGNSDGNYIALAALEGGDE